MIGIKNPVYSPLSKSKFLPAISRILSQLQCLVSNNFLKMEVDVSSQSLSWDSDHNYPEYCEETTSISGDEERDVMSSTPDEERNVMKSIRKDEEDKFTASIKKAEDDKFITSMIMFIRTSSPNLVFSQSKSNKRRKRRLKKIVHRAAGCLVKLFRVCVATQNVYSSFLLFISYSGLDKGEQALPFQHTCSIPPTFTRMFT